MSDSEYQPLTGDPDLLESKASHYAEIADAITRSVTTLRKVHGIEGMTSKAVDAIRDKAEQVANDIDKARDRYVVTASSLTTYSRRLRLAQDAANTAIMHINTKQEAANHAHSALTRAFQTAEASTPDTKDADHRLQTTAQDGADTADQELAVARKAWHDALEDKNTAAGVAISAITEVVSGKKNHGLADGLWDDFVGSDFFKILKTVCDWAGVLAIFLSWVPILGQFLIVLAAVGAVLAIVQAAVKLSEGKGSWGDLIFAVGIGVLTVFGRKIFAVLGENARGAVALKTFSKVGNDVKAGRALQGETAIGLRQATRMSQTGFRDVLKDPLFLGDAGRGFHLDGLGDLAKKSLQSSVSHLTPSGMAGESAWALGNMAKSSPGLFSTGEKVATVVSGYGAFATNVGLDKLAVDTVEETFGGGKE